MKPSRLAVTSAVVVVLSVGTYAMASPSNDSSTPSASALADQDAGTEIPASTLALLNEQDIKVAQLKTSEVADASIATDRTARAGAVSAARASFGLDTASEARSVALVSLTQGSKYKNRIVWLVTLDDVPNPYLGPAQEHMPASVPGTMVAPVDAATGKVLFAFVS